MKDLRDDILQSVMQKTATACILSDGNGVIAGADLAGEKLGELGLIPEFIAGEGTVVNEGDVIMRFSGNPKQVLMAEEVLIGLMSKPSGIATATRAFVKKADGKFRIVSGAWKKMPPSLKSTIRNAVVTGGGFFRLTQDPFVYLDKNYVELLGGIQQCLEAVEGIKDHKKVVQLKGRYENGDIAREALLAIASGADILSIDTGCIEDARKVTEAVRSAADKQGRSGRRKEIEVSFSGNIQLEDLPILKDLGVDVVDIGRRIVDAPLLDMKMEAVIT